MVVLLNMMKLRIAIIGTKGIPAKWGGIEKYIEEIGKRLVERGHEVTVFCSRWYTKDFGTNTYKGMRIVRVSTLHHNATDALTNAFLSWVSILRSSFDVVHFHSYGSYYFVPFVKWGGKKTVITTHGVESGWENRKYGSFARYVLKTAFKVGILNSNAVTTVSDHLRAKIKDMYGVDAGVLPGGLDEATFREPFIIKNKYSLIQNKFLLFLGRIDPIKRIHWILDLEDLMHDDMRIVIAGGAQDSSTSAYLKELERNAGSKTIFTGPVYGEEKEELLSNCLALTSPSWDEGMPLTLLEAAAYGKCCIASDIPAYRTIIEDNVSGFMFPREEKQLFIAKTRELLGMPRTVIAAIGMEAQKRALARFSWERTTDLAEEIYISLLASANRL